VDPEREPAELRFHNLSQFQLQNRPAGFADQRAVLVSIDGRRFAQTAGDSRLGTFRKLVRRLDATFGAGSAGQRFESALARLTDVIETALRLAAVEDVFRTAKRAGYL
jgi:hypothetical protein